MNNMQKLDYSLISIDGSDSTKFLQSIITGDVTQKSLYALLLSPQGKFLFDFFINHINGKYIIEIKTEQANEFITKLKLYKFRSQISITKMEDYYALYSRETINSDLKLFEYKDPRFNKLGFRTIVSKNFILEKESDCYLEDKYKFAIPEGYIELIQDKSMPLEYGIDKLNGISYNKGCYIGQEVISRTTYQGVVRKQIFRISSDKNLSDIAPSSEIYENDKKIGILCSSYNNSGIALIRIENYQQNSNIYLNSNPIILSKAEWYENI